MTIIQSIILGIIQGATEFIPISSSGHLVLAPSLLGWKLHPKEAFVFDVLAQFATLFAVLIYFRSDLMTIFISVLRGIRNRSPFADPQSKLGWLLVLSTIPAGLAALLFKEFLEKTFNNPIAAAYFLYGTAMFLVLAEIFQTSRRSMQEANWLDALIIGTFQVFALFPGISRSGSTISGGMLRGFKRSAAARFSFLMSVPILVASGVLALIDLFKYPELLSQFPIYFAGFVTAAGVGYVVIHWLLGYLSSKSLYPFAVYCGSLATIILLIMRIS